MARVARIDCAGEQPGFPWRRRSGRRFDGGSRRGPMSEAKPGPAQFANLAITVAVFGAAFPILKWGGAAATPVWFATVRAGICAVVALAVLVATGRLARPRGSDLAPIIAIGVFQIAGFFALLQAALMVVPAGRSAVLAYTTSLWLVPIGALFLGEAVGPRRLLAVLFGVAGIAVIANPWTLDWQAGGTATGHALLFGASLSWAIAIAMLRGARPVLSTLQLLPFAFALATLLLLALAVLIEPAGGVGVGVPSLAALAYVGILGPLATWAATEVTRQLPAVVSSLAFLGVPVLGLLLSTLVLGEPLGPPLLAGSALVIGAVAVVVRD